MPLNLLTFKHALDSVTDGVGIVDQSSDGTGRLIYVNRALHQLFAASGHDDLLGRSLLELFSKRHKVRLAAMLSEAITKVQSRQLTVSIESVKGQLRWLKLSFDPLIQPSGTSPYLILVVEDITEQRKLQRSLRRAAQHDSLTGLLNHRCFHERMRAEFNRIKRYGGECALVVFDLDHFKEVNDNYGHPFGDRVLKQVADIANNCVRKSDVVARVGGEEFAILLPHANSDTARRIAERLCGKLAQKVFKIKDQIVSVTASAGVADSRLDDPKPPKVLNAADAALYRAKKLGRNRVEVWSVGTRSDG